MLNWFKIFDRKRVLVTGGTGSFGRTFIKYILKFAQPAEIVVFSRDEHKQQLMSRYLSDKPVKFVIGDVRDREALQKAMKNINFVVHAAALKHVDVCERNPVEAVKTNVFGAENVTTAANYAGVEKAVLISTDKAVNPVGVYGNTKSLAEKIFINANIWSDTKFAVVRFGNMTWSRGSFIPYLKILKQKGKTTVPVTHPDMTRFFITPFESALLTAKAFNLMEGGEVFIPKCKSVKIIELVKSFIPDAEIVIIGKRPGEKIYEELLNADEVTRTRYIKELQLFLVKPPWEEWSSSVWEQGDPLPQNFEYASNKANWIVSPKEILCQK